MGEINIPEHEQQALMALEMDAVDRAIDQAISTERIGALYSLPLRSCGEFVAAKLASFERALQDHGQAKAYQKRERTGESLRRAGRDLSFAASAMKRRLAEDQKERQLFQIDDQISPPILLNRRISVLVHYRWRMNTDDPWQSGRIVFSHNMVDRPTYGLPAPKRKPSAAKREQEIERKCYDEWEHLKSGALYSIRDFFRAGGSGDRIPETFQAVVDRDGQLNNLSTRFWEQEAKK